MAGAAAGRELVAAVVGALERRMTSWPSLQVDLKNAAFFAKMVEAFGASRYGRG